jgi:hypothetical protein
MNHSLTRRALLTLGAVAWWTPRAFAAAGTQSALTLPREVAGIAIPRSSVALRAAAFAQQGQPDYLFNHSLRTFVFGALYAAHKGLAFDADAAFIAAGSFEIDGANAAEKFGKSLGMSGRSTDLIWHSVEMHDGKWALTSRQGPEAMLVAAGAAADVDGPDPSIIDGRQAAEAVAAFPRLQFKARFTALLVDHCRRKPLSQRSTWLEGLCRRTAPAAWTDSVENDIAAAPFAE